MEKKEPLQCSWECKLAYPFLENSIEVPQKLQTGGKRGRMMEGYNMTNSGYSTCILGNMIMKYPT
jgi:hypothetical protein